MTTVSSLSLDHFDRLPAHTRRCIYWEVDPATAEHHEIADPMFEKEAWLSSVMLKWGSCAQVAISNGYSIGCAVYSPPLDVPRAAHFPTSPVSPDAVLLTTVETSPTAALAVAEPTSRIGDIEVAATLVRAVVADLVRRGVRALEAFGYISGTLDIERARSSDEATATRLRNCTDETCVIPASFLQSMGFEVVAPHHRHPRLRLELDRDHEWKVDVEYALERLLATAALTTVGVGSG